MAAVAGAAASSGGGILGSVISNKLNKKAAKKQRQFNRTEATKSWRRNARQAQLNRHFQRDMSNTAYQRASRDLEKAGLNRILAFGQPASTPGGSQASGTAASGGAAPQSFDFGDPVGTAVQVAQADASIANTRQGTATAVAQERSHNANAAMTEAKTVVEKIKGDVYQHGRNWFEKNQGNIEDFLNTAWKRASAPSKPKQPKKPRRPAHKLKRRNMRPHKSIGGFR